ncbi:MAG: hypothetical protein C5B54_04475 [Acidobacteria bacterium]|nr:MAG: hypothetical protein C5B54_04475 [Acidobacteriota bacterium]
MLREALVRSARVCAVTREKVEKIHALYPEVRAVWIPNGIDLNEWQPLPSHLKHAHDWRHQNVKASRKVLGLFGHIKLKKGGLFFLQNFYDSGTAHRFHLLAIGEAEPEVLSWLSEHAQCVDYQLIPFVDRSQLLGWYPACDLVVLPSFYDGMPNVLLEAAALGIPLLASQAGGMDDVLEEGKHAFLFAPGNGEECRSAIAKAANSEELRGMGEACRTVVQNEFNHHLEAERYLAVFHETLASQRQIIGGAS